MNYLYKLVEPDLSINETHVLNLLRQYNLEFIWYKLKPFQQENIIHHLQRDGRSISSLDQGFGKSACALICCMLFRAFWPLLIITTKSNMISFYIECKKWLGLTDDDIHVASDAKKTFKPKTPKPCTCNRDMLDDNNTSSTNKLCKGCKYNNKINNTDAQSSFQSFKPLNKLINIISHTSAKLRIHELQNKFKVVVLDESQCMSNSDSQMSQTLSQLCAFATYCILCSGTPLSTPIQMYEQSRVIQPFLFPNYIDFVKRYCKPIIKTPKNGAPYLDMRGASNADELSNKLKKYMLYRWTKAQQEEKCIAEGIPFTLPPKKRFCYKMYLPIEQEEKCQQQIQEWKDKCDEMSGKNSNNNNASVGSKRKTPDSGSSSSTGTSSNSYNAEQEAITKLLEQILSSTNASNKNSGGNATNAMFSKMVTDLSKVKRKLIRDRIENEIEEQNEYKANFKKLIHRSLVEITDGFPRDVSNIIADYDRRSNRKIIFWGHSKQTLKTISDTLNDLQLTFIYIDGSTKLKLRANQIIDFQDNKYDAAVFSLKACNAGITATAASISCVTEIVPDPKIMLQAEDRIHRLSQEDSEVQIKYWITDNTIDMIIWQLICKKVYVATSILDQRRIKTAEWVTTMVDPYTKRTDKLDAEKNKANTSNNNNNIKRKAADNSTTATTKKQKTIQDYM